MVKGVRVKSVVCTCASDAYKRKGHAIWCAVIRDAVKRKR